MKGSKISGSSGVAQTGKASSSEGAVPLDIQPGQSLSATILEVTGKGEVLIGMRGLRVKARTEVPLQRGRTYDFVVKFAGEQLQLSLGDGELAEARIAAGVTKLLARGGITGLGLKMSELEGELADSPLSRLLKKLRRWPDTTVKLRDYLSGLGITNEGCLRQAASRGEAPPADLATNLKSLLIGTSGEKATSLLEKLEGLQGENLHRQRCGGGQVYPLPRVPGVRSGELYFFPAELAGNKEIRPSRVVFNLDLEQLGPLGIELESRGEQLHLQFSSSVPETVARLKSQLGDLRESLIAAGLRPVAMDVIHNRSSEYDSVPPLSGRGLVDVEG